jgi:hypothetical protein
MCHVQFAKDEFFTLNGTACHSFVNLFAKKYMEILKLQNGRQWTGNDQ